VGVRLFSAMRSAASATLATVLVCGATSSCHGQSAPQARPAQEYDVPRVAPDTVATSDVERNLDRATGIVRDVVLIMFEQSASLAERRSVIASIRGRVIGGLWFETDVEGYYVVRIPDTGDPFAVFTVIDEVSKCPCVDFAEAWIRIPPA